MLVSAAWLPSSMVCSVLLIRPCGRIVPSGDSRGSSRLSSLAGCVNGLSATALDSLNFPVSVVEDPCGLGGTLDGLSDGKALSGAEAFPAVDISCLAAYLKDFVTQARILLLMRNHSNRSGCDMRWVYRSWKYDEFMQIEAAGDV